ncbi:MAG: polyprenyl synthetase family protein [Syntrophaceae bacterium]|nr:polyprenyl synthetase family protein [Syntrophaceae bacterium]
MQMQDVFRYFTNDLQRVEEYLEKHLRSEVQLIPEIIHHLISSGGKRFRPLLLLATAELCGNRGGERRYTLSAALEFIHTASLLHDDVVDRAETRRGKASANHIWGNATSVLVGDYLYSKAFQLMTDDGNPAIFKLLTTSTITMSEGEVFQLVKAGDISITEKEYLSIIEKKTSILISAACAIGGILGDASESQIEALTRFGMRLGTAFQLTDDTLDYVAKEEEFGKAIGQDLSEGKLTLPLIRTIKKCTPEERALIRKGIEEKDAGATAEIPVLIKRYDGIPYALAKAKTAIEEAKGFLALFPDSEAKTALIAIADYIIERQL